MSYPLYIALVHYPVLNKHGETVTTSVTNFDLHDLARSCQTYGAQSCFIITPSKVQQDMVRYIRNYWENGVGAAYNPDRKEAFDVLEIASNLEESRLTIESKHGISPILVSTTAKKQADSVSYKDLKVQLESEGKPCLLVFGTGWGLVSEVLEKSDFILDPIYGPTDYNHLSVRSAVAIVLDRLCGA